MTLRTTLLIGLAGLCLTPTVWSAKDIVGQVVFLTGKVDVTRNNKTEALKIGSDLENYDRITVAKGGTAEIKFDPKTGVAASVKLASGTILGIDITALKSQQKGGLDLIAGNLECKVSKLGGGNSLDVRTGTANMGVRGTTFQVNVAASGDILLSTDEGRVECTTDSGKSLYSEPGKIVQGNLNEEWSNVPVAISSLEKFRSQWITEKIAAFNADPGRALNQYAKQYNQYVTKFYESYKDLLSNRDILQKWIKEEGDGQIGALADRNREKTAIIAPLTKLRASLFILERIYFRLNQVVELVKGTNVTGKLDNGQTASEFIADFQSQAADLQTRMNDVNFVIKLYAKRNDGSFPLNFTVGGSSSQFTDSSNFFNH